MRRLLTGLWCLSAIASCKSIDELEDQRAFASGRFSNKEVPADDSKTTINDSSSDTKVVVPAPSVSQSRSSDSQYIPPADTVSQSGDLAPRLKGNWISTCQPLDSSSQRAWYQRSSLFFENGNEGVLSLSIYSDNSCSKAPSASELASAQLAAKIDKEFGFLLGQVYANQWVGFDLSIAGEPTVFLSARIEGNELTLTRACTAAAIKAKYCDKISGGKGDQRALDERYVQKFQKR